MYFGEACHVGVGPLASVEMGAVQPQVPVLAMGEGRGGEGCEQRTDGRPSPWVLMRAVMLLCKCTQVLHVLSFSCICDLFHDKNRKTPMWATSFLSFLAAHAKGQVACSMECRCKWALCVNPDVLSRGCPASRWGVPRTQLWSQLQIGLGSVSVCPGLDRSLHPPLWHSQ